MPSQSTSECGAKALPHLFIEIRNGSNEDSSRQVASEFCKAFSRQFGREAAVREIEPGDGAFDAIVEINTESVALEFLSYRQRDEFHELEVADSRIRGKLSHALSSADIPVFQVRIYWAQERRRNSDSADDFRARLPKGTLQEDEFVNEFVQLARYVAAKTNLLNKHIGFAYDPDERNLIGPEYWRWVDSADFPSLARHCYYVELEAWPHQFRPELRTSADFRDMWFDEELLRQKLEDKVAKLPRYHQSAGEMPVWLVVHSDGTPLSTHVHPGVHDRIVATIQQVSKTASASFDHVWWLENSGFVNSGELFSVV